MNGKKKYQAMFNELKALINAWDPYGLIEEGSPTDEFESEIAKILVGLSKCKSSEDTTKLIAGIFRQSFEVSKFSDDYCKQIGDKVYAWYKNFRF